MIAKLTALLGLTALAFSAQAEFMELNGTQLEYEIKGSGQHIVLFDAGALSGMAGWDPIWDRLPADITAIRYSRRGEGSSGSCEGDWTAADYTKDTEQLLRKLGIKGPFIYVAHSYGGALAREYAARNPDMLSAMLFVDPSNPRDIEVVAKVDPVNGPAEIERIKRDDLKAGVGKWCFVKDLWNKGPIPGFEEMGDIPVTLIAGVKHEENPQMIFHQPKARDLWGRVQAEWVSQFPRGKAVMAKESGHMVPQDQPELVVSELSELLERAD